MSKEGRVRIPEFRDKREGEDCTCTDLQPAYPGIVDKCLACGREIKGLDIQPDTGPKPLCDDLPGSY